MAEECTIPEDFATLFETGHDTGDAARAGKYKLLDALRPILKECREELKSKEADVEVLGSRERLEKDVDRLGRAEEVG